MRIVVLLWLVAGVTLAACAGSPPPERAESAAEEGAQERTTGGANGPEETEAAVEAVDPAEVGANELGEVPVLMYHRVLKDATGDYDITPAQFRAELQYLYDNDYRPVRVVDIVTGDLDVPAGMTPFAMTFDDSSSEQMAYDDDGKIDRRSAVGILLDFAKAHPDFEPVASFYVNAGPFGGGSDGPDMLRDLHERGFELGNHTASHAHLGQLSEEGVAQELAAGAAVITEAVPDARVRTLSLPLGIWPEPRKLAYKGDGYRHEGILLVGANPAPSPFHRDFEARAIPRIRSAPGWDGGEPDYGSGYWLSVLEESPERRYVSDGDPNRISFPRGKRGELARRFADAANPYTAP